MERKRGAGCEVNLGVIDIQTILKATGMDGVTQEVRPEGKKGNSYLLRNCNISLSCPFHLLYFFYFIISSGVHITYYGIIITCKITVKSAQFHRLSVYHSFFIEVYLMYNIICFRCTT